MSVVTRVTSTHANGDEAGGRIQRRLPPRRRAAVCRDACPARPEAASHGARPARRVAASCGARPRDSRLAKPGSASSGGRRLLPACLAVPVPARRLVFSVVAPWRPPLRMLSRVVWGGGGGAGPGRGGAGRGRPSTAGLCWGPRSHAPCPHVGCNAMSPGDHTGNMHRFQWIGSVPRGRPTAAHTHACKGAAPIGQARPTYSPQTRSDMASHTLSTPLCWPNTWVLCPPPRALAG
jgi:hypothetical protein